MPVFLLEFLWWMQPEATGSAPAAVPGAEGAATGGGGGFFSGGSSMFMLVMMFGIFYFMLIRPQQKRQKETDDMLKSLRKGDKVRTSGGIRGEILDLNDSDVTLLIADKVKINILRSHVGSKVEKPAADTKEKT